MKEEKVEYQEKIDFPLVFIPAALMGFMSGFFFYKWVKESRYTYGVFFFLFNMFLFLMVLMLNFVRLTIRISDSTVRVAFGLFGRTIPVENIEKVYPDEASALYYGGWGIRLGWFKGKFRQAWSVIGAPRIVLKLKKATIPEVVFSTNNPEKVTEIIEKTKKTEKTGTKKG